MDLDIEKILYIDKSTHRKTIDLEKVDILGEVLNQIQYGVPKQVFDLGKSTS